MLKEAQNDRLKVIETIIIYLFKHIKIGTRRQQTNKHHINNQICVRAGILPGCPDGVR